jgi:hypothetical protein
VTKLSCPFTPACRLLRKNKTVATRQQIPITPTATAIPIPALAPLLSPPLVPAAVTFSPEPPVVLAAAEPDVLLAAELVVCAATLDVDVDELAKFHPLICTPWITVPDPVIDIVVGYQVPAEELRGVITCPLVRVEKHSFASGAGAMTF